jgi:RNA ligase (TIGR02306 family)
VKDVCPEFSCGFLSRLFARFHFFAMEKNETPELEAPGLATIVKVLKLSPICGADKICLAQIRGWQCVVKIDEFAVDDLAIYFVIDSIPDFSDPNTEVVRKRGGRVKTCKLRGVVSQGLLAPLSWLESRGHSIENILEGEDVTIRMGVTKYVSQEEEYQYFGTLANKAEGGSFPLGIPKTDEKKLQSYPEFLDYIKDRRVVITRKEDGCSATFVFQDGVFQVCGRNCAWSEPRKETSHYFTIAAKENIEAKMSQYNQNLAIQGEIVGPKINGNRLRLSELHFRVFRIWNINEFRFLWWNELLEVCQQLSLDHVPVVFWGNAVELDLSLEGLLQLAEDQRYGTGILAEGIVVKADEGQPISFKVISNKYLLKHDL